MKQESENKATVIIRGPDWVEGCPREAAEPREVPGGSLDACGDDSQANSVDKQCSGVMTEMLGFLRLLCERGGKTAE